MIDPGRHTSGRIAMANLSASIDGLELGRRENPTFEALDRLSGLLFLRGDLLGRIADHDHAEIVAREAIDLDSARAGAVFLRARLAGRFHHFGEARTLLDEALAAGHPRPEVEAELAALLQATGDYREALALRKARADEDPSIRTLGSLASLLAEGFDWAAAESCYTLALEADEGASPIPSAQVLFEWGVGAMRRRDLDRADEILGEVARMLPQHVPARGHRAEVALARGERDLALLFIWPLPDNSDDPEYRATYAEILDARGEHELAAVEASRAAAAYDALLARRPEAYADHAAAFFMGLGRRPRRALELARANWNIRRTPRSRRLLERARRHAGFA